MLSKNTKMGTPIHIIDINVIESPSHPVITSYSIHYTKLYDEMSRKRALITGITGMVGSHLADYLLENTDWDIYGMCRWRSPLDNIQHLITYINSNERVFLVYGDLNDYASIQSVIEGVMPDYIFHLAAQSYPKTSFEAPLETLA